MRLPNCHPSLSSPLPARVPHPQPEDGTNFTLRKRAPQFHISERFCENFGVRPAAPPHPGAQIAVPLKSDELNFYQLAITHSDGLTKDECFVHVREILLGLAQAAGAGEEVVVDFGIGIFISLNRDVSFDFGANGAGQLALRKGGDLKVSLDPMMGARASAHAPTLLLVGAGRGGGMSHFGSRLGSSELSAVDSEVETQLLREIDLLDPETRARGGSLSQLLEEPTYSRIGQALQLDPDALRDRPLSELNDALIGRAAALEAQLLTVQRATQELEARLDQQERQRPAGSNLSLRRGQRGPQQHPAAAAAARGVSFAGPGGLTLGGTTLGGGRQRRALPVRRAPAPPQRGGVSPHGGLGAGGAPILSVGFHGSPAPAAPSPAKSPKRVFGEGPVPVAPPLPPYRGPLSMPTRDAAERAWRAHAAPELKKGLVAGRGRLVGKTALGAMVSAAPPAPTRPHYRATLG